MSQPSVTAYFNTRKRQACDGLRGKSKVLLLGRDNQAPTSIENLEQASDETSTTGTSPKNVLQNATANLKGGGRTNKPIRNIQFDPSKASKTRMRATRSRTLPSTDGSQTDIRDSFLKVGNDPETKKVPFEKKGTFSPKKKKQQQPRTPKKASAVSKDNTTREAEKEYKPADGSLTPPSSKKLSTMEGLVKSENLSLTDIKNRINKSSRLAELKAITQRIANYDQELKQLRKQDEIKKPQMQKFERVELEIPLR